MAGSEPLVVCDACWRLAGGSAVIGQRVAGRSDAPVLAMDPVVEALLADAEEHDQLHPLDRMLVDAGLRWSLVRRLVPAARTDLALRVLSRDAPDQTRLAAGPQVWLDGVTDRIYGSSGDRRQQSEYTYRGKKRRWWRIARVLAVVAHADRRPRTWISQEEIAAAVGCSDRTVRRAVAWLQGEGLLHELVPGCRLPMAALPEDATPAERADAAERVAAAQRVEAARMDRARAEVDAVHAGRRGRAAAAGHVEPIEDPRLVNIAPVYELRTPLTDAERAEAAATVRACTPDQSPGERLALANTDQLVAPQNAHLYERLWVISPDGHVTALTAAAALETLTCGNAVALSRTNEFVHPSEMVTKGKSSACVRVVDKRRASRGSDTRGSRQPGNSGAEWPVDGETANGRGVSSPKRESRAVRAARALLDRLLDPRVCDGVSIRWLAAAVRGSGLLEHGWSESDLADQIHGVGQYARLPYHVAAPRGWIRARLAAAVPTLTPARLVEIARIEDNSPWFARRRERARRAASDRQAADIARRRARIESCPLCDELGWLHTDEDTPVVACTHDTDTGGW